VFRVLTCSDASGVFPHPYLYFRLIFAYPVAVWNLPEARLCDYTIRCKGCGENIPAPVQTMPDTWIIAECPLCGERRGYLPPDIFRGRLSYLLKKPVKSERGQSWAK
jgi:hypothetical protein